MGNPILLLRLEGPLQSWGIRSRWSKRDTGPEPTKSAIIGMLGCAAGILRPDWRAGKEPDRTLEDWDRALRFGVRIDRPGVIETDYHTVEGPLWNAKGDLKDVPAEQSWREYIHDAAFLVAMEQNDGGRDLLDMFASDLQRPKWPLFLGRKACMPSRPVLDRTTEEYQDLEAALRTEPWSCHIGTLRRYESGWFRRHPRVKQLNPPQRLTAWIEDPAGDYERPDAIRLNQLRFYDFRRCSRIAIDSQHLAWRLN